MVSPSHILFLCATESLCIEIVLFCQIKEDIERCPFLFGANGCLQQSITVFGCLKVKTYNILLLFYEIIVNFYVEKIDLLRYNINIIVFNGLK